MTSLREATREFIVCYMPTRESFLYKVPCYFWEIKVSPTVGSGVGVGSHVVNSMSFIDVGKIYDYISCVI